MATKELNQLGTDCRCFREGLAAGVDGSSDSRGWIPTVCPECGRFFGRRPPEGKKPRELAAVEVESMEETDEDLGA